MKTTKTFRAIGQRLCGALDPPLDPANLPWLENADGDSIQEVHDVYDWINDTPPSTWIALAQWVQSVCRVVLGYLVFTPKSLPESSPDQACENYTELVKECFEEGDYDFDATNAGNFDEEYFVIDILSDIANGYLKAPAPFVEFLNSVTDQDIPLIELHRLEQRNMFKLVGDKVVYDGDCDGVDSADLSWTILDILASNEYVGEMYFDQCLEHIFETNEEIYYSVPQRMADWRAKN